MLDMFPPLEIQTSENRRRCSAYASFDGETLRLNGAEYPIVDVKAVFDHCFDILTVTADIFDEVMRLAQFAHYRGVIKGER